MTGMSHRPASPLLVLISAPSGGGKTTVCQQLLARHHELTRVVTCTTRPPRPGEGCGIDYHFLEETAFEQRVQAGEFLEHARSTPTATARCAPRCSIACVRDATSC
jgi:guanylate kinase